MKKITLTHEETNTSKKFTQEKITIGRSNSCDVTVPKENDTVSKHHCTIIQDEIEICIIDDGSKNKTRVHGKKLSKGKGAPLSNGTEIKLGDYTLKVLINDEDQDNKPAPLDEPQPADKEEAEISLADESNAGQLKMPSAAELEEDLEDIDAATQR